MAELKSCPFCGEIPYIERKPLWKEYGGSTNGTHAHQKKEAIFDYYEFYNDIQ